MDRTALSKRISGLADVFATGSVPRRELEALSYALENMRDEKFASILNEGIEADDKDANVRGYGVAQPVQKHEMAISQRARQPQGKLQPQDIAYLEDLMARDPTTVLKVIKSKPEQAPAQAPAGVAPAGVAPAGKLADDEVAQPQGSAWNREASDAVIRNLVSDVLGREAMQKTVCCDSGRQLEKKQMPDATKKQERPATLTEEQTPKLSEALDSGMYEKSKGAVRKEAAKADAPVTGEALVTEEAPADALVTEEASAEKAPAEKVPVAKQMAKKKVEREIKKTQEDAKDTAKDTAKALTELEDLQKKTASDASSNMIMFDGIELTAPMDEVELTAQDVETLGKLFQ